MSWLYKYFRLTLGGTYPSLQLHGATLTLSGTGATLTLASGATANEFSTDGTLSGNSDTALPTEKAVKTYVDTYATALKWKDVVVCATTADGTLATAYANGQTVDGVTLVTGDRILLKNQTDQKVNGIYTVNATGAPTRATDADTAAELLGCIVPVLEGTTNADSAWVNSNDTITLGSSNITFILYGGMKAGNGLTLTADVMSIDVAITADLSTIQTFTNKTLTSPKINEDVVMTGTATELNDAVSKKHAQNTDTGTTGTTFTIDSDSTTGKFVLQAAGGGNFTLTLQTPTIAGAVAITLPALTGTLATLAGTEALTNKTLTSPKVNEDVVFAGTSTQLASCITNDHVQHTDTGTTATTFTVDSDSTTGKLALTAAGGGDFTLTIQTPTIAGAVAITLPAVTGTLATLAGAEALTGKTQLVLTTQSSEFDNPALTVGKYSVPIADTALVDNVLASFVGSTGTNKTSADTSSMLVYLKNSTTAAVTNNKMQTILSVMSIGHDVFDAYGGQFRIEITDDMATQAGNANLVGLACKANIADTKTATGNVSAFYVVLDTGSGDTATGTYDMIRMENNAAQCDSAINFGSTTNMAYLMTMGDAGCISSNSGTAPAGDGVLIKVKVGSTDLYLKAASSWT